MGCVDLTPPVVPPPGPVDMSHLWLHWVWEICQWTRSHVGQHALMMASCHSCYGCHPFSHFLATQHTFSMQLGKTQRVWDYIGGGFVSWLKNPHRLGSLHPPPPPPPLFTLTPLLLSPPLFTSPPPPPFTSSPPTPHPCLPLLPPPHPCLYHPPLHPTSVYLISPPPPSHPCLPLPPSSPHPPPLFTLTPLLPPPPTPVYPYPPSPPTPHPCLPLPPLLPPPLFTLTPLLPPPPTPVYPYPPPPPTPHPPPPPPPLPPYSSDNYVHRLVQNKGDGKLVEVGSGGGQGLLSEEKIDSLQLEVSWSRVPPWAPPT